MKRRRSRKTIEGLRPAMPGLPVRFTAFFDGCCEPVNPGGTAGYGAIIFDRDGKQTVRCPHPKFGVTVFTQSGIVEASPTTSNNVAEYLAVEAIFDWLIQQGHQDEAVHIFGDSRLVICQLWGWPEIGRNRWKIHGIDTRDKAPGRYAETAVRARTKLKQLPRTLGGWIPRDENSIADDLSKAHLRQRGVEFRIQPEDDKDAA